jgi:uncharacterized damage-inducible protein DinB
MSVTAGFPDPIPDELELYLRWLAFLRGAVLRKASGIDEAQARWRPDGKLLSLLGIVNHLTHVEWRWIDGAMLGQPTSKDDDEYEPGPSLTMESAIAAYRARAAATDAAVREIGDPAAPGHAGGGGTDLRFVLLHLINETARHAGHADAVRELLDGTVGE